jgi:tetratricopeptide (TPR) repeat protein
MMMPASCKTFSGGGDSGDDLDSDQPEGVDGDAVTTQGSGDMSNIPPSLWSPGQRRSQAGVYFLVAEFTALKERNPRKALRYYESAYGLDPNPFLGGKMLLAKAGAGDRAEALLEAKKMVLLYPRDPHLRYFFGELLIQAGQLDDAAEQFERCIELDPLNESAYLNLTEVYQGLKQPARALVVAREFSNHLPGSFMAWAQLARLHLAQNQYKEALVPARRAYEMQSQNPNVVQMYAVVLQLNKKTKQAVRIYEQLYRLDPSDEGLTGRMVELYRELGNLESALELLDEMVEQAGENKPAIQIQKALIFWELKRNSDALKLLGDLRQAYPESDRVKYLYGFALERVEKYDDALAVYSSFDDKSTLRGQADVRSISILRHQKKYDEAIAKAEELLADEGADADVYGLAANAYADAERYKDAIEVLTKGFQKFPAKVRLLFMSGVYHEKAGDIDGCIKVMKDVIRKDATNSSAYNYLGYLYAERGQNLDEAEQLIKKALELKPDDGFYLDSLGWVFYQKGNYKLALEYLQRALKIEPKEGVIMEHVADVKLKQGDLAGAREYYEKALKGDLEPKDKARIEGKLSDVESSLAKKK